MTNPIRTIGLFGKYGDDNIGDRINELAGFLLDRGLKVVIESGTAERFQILGCTNLPLDEIGTEIDLAIIIGGDGTLLNVARSIVVHDVPMVGVNLGRLGFLTDISPSEMVEEIGKILDGDYELEHRTLLVADVMRAGKIIHSSRAFNDVIVNKGNLARLIDFETYIDGEFVNSMRADGIIVATPTGSTAYALSAGGPILHPSLAAMVLVPICPHTLSDRPIVISDSSVAEIVITVLGGQQAYLTFDGQASFSLQEQDHVFVRKMEMPISLIHPSDRNHYSVLRAKLHWGEKL